MVARANSARIQVCPAVWSGSPSGGPHQDIVHLYVALAAEHGDHRLGNVGGGENVEHVVGGHAAEGCCDPHAKPRSHDTSRIAWANRMARVGEEFLLECPSCGGDIRLIVFRLFYECETIPGLRTLGNLRLLPTSCPRTRPDLEDPDKPGETLRRRHKIATASFFLDNSVGYADSYNMTLELKIRRVGNSLGVIIPTEALALLNVREGDVLFLTEAAEGSVRLSAQCPGFAEKAAIADDLIQRYRNAFNELAK